MFSSKVEAIELKSLSKKNLVCDEKKSPSDSVDEREKTTFAFKQKSEDVFKTFSRIKANNKFIDTSDASVVLCRLL